MGTPHGLFCSVNLTFEQTSERFDIPIRTLFRCQNKLEPYLIRNKPATKIDMEALKKDVEQHPDDYQWERAKRFNVSQSTMGLALKRLGISNKNLKHPKADDKLRADFQEKITGYESEGRSIAYVDESGFEQSMPRTHGYSLVGVRCHDTHDWHAKGRINAIGAIIGFTLVTVCLFEGSINADTFYAWLTQDLLPKLPDNAVIVMDNATFHKHANIA